MTLKPIIDIGVNSEAFDRFMEAFKIYEDKLQDMPAEWTRVNTAVNDFAKLQIASGVGAAEAFKNATKLSGEFTRATKAASAFNKAVDHGVSKLHTAGNAVPGIGHELFGLSKHVLRIGEIGGLFGILGAAAGGFGLDKLAQGAMTSQNAASGMGLSVGQMRAFNVNMQPFVGPEVLQAAANAQNNVGMAGAFSLLHINRLQANREPASKLAVQLIEEAHRAYQRNPDRATNPEFSALQQVGGFTVADWRRVGMSSNGWRHRSEAQIAKDAATLGATVKQNREWQRLAVTLDKLGFVINTSLLQGLQALTPAMGSLAKGAAAAISAFANSPTIQRDMQELGGYLSSKSFQSDIAGFWADLKSAGAALATFGGDVVAVAKKLEWIISSPAGNKTAADKWNNANRKPNGTAIDVGAVAGWAMGGPLGALAGGWLGSQVGMSVDLPPGVGGTPAGPFHPSARQKFEASSLRMMGEYRRSTIMAAARKYSARYHVPLDLAVRQLNAESGMGAHLFSPKGAAGVAQIMPREAAAAGIDPLRTDASVRYMMQTDAANYKKFHDWQKAVAAYNMGPTALASDLKKHGAAWLNVGNAPDETRNYVSKVAGGDARQTGREIGKGIAQTMGSPQWVKTKPAHVLVTNNTSAQISQQAWAGQ